MFISILENICDCGEENQLRRNEKVRWVHMKKMVANEKIDYLSYIICFLIGIIGLLITKLMGVKIEWLMGFWYVFIITFPTGYRRRKKQYQKIDELRKILDLSIEDIRKIVDIGKYDLMDWQWDKAFISSKKLYLLEDKLETMYLIRFKKSLNLRSQRQKETA